MSEPSPRRDPDEAPHGQDELRARAAARARHDAADEPTDSVLHELRVHQIELEMQNDELRRAQADLEASRARYFDLYDLAPVGYCTLDAAGLVTEVNLTAARLLGVTKDLVVGKPLTDFLHPDSQDAFYQSFRQLQDSRPPPASELRFQRGPGTSFWAWVEIHAARGPQDTFACRIAFTDISLLKRHQQRGSGSEG